jgi:hypothetical protein
MGSLRQLRHKYSCHGRWEARCEHTCYEVEICRNKTLQAHQNDCVVRSVSPLVIPTSLYKGPIGSGSKEKTHPPREYMGRRGLLDTYEILEGRFEFLGFQIVPINVMDDGKLAFMRGRKQSWERIEFIFPETRIESLYALMGRKEKEKAYSCLEAWCFDSTHLHVFLQKIEAAIVTTRKKWPQWEA